jgi:hypothetical protein
MAQEINAYSSGVVNILHGIMNTSLIIHEKNTREITAIAEFNVSGKE